MPVALAYLLRENAMRNAALPTLGLDPPSCASAIGAVAALAGMTKIQPPVR